MNRENDEEYRPRSAAAHEKILGRILALSDGVFAIAITLLILNISVPDSTTMANLPSAINGLWPNITAFITSFFVIGLYWMVHVRQFRSIIKYDSSLLWLNLVFLLFIVIIPFSSSIMSDFAGTLTVSIYAVNMVCAGLASTFLWIYVTHRHRLVAENLGSAQVRRGIILNLIAPVIFTLSIGIAIFNSDAAQYSWISIFVFYIVAQRAFKLPKADENI